MVTLKMPKIFASDDGEQEVANEIIGSGRSKFPQSIPLTSLIWGDSWAPQAFDRQTYRKQLFYS